jgi:RNA polymerase sigma-70 factor, ECF subfamily
MQEITREVLIKASDGDLSAFELIYKATSGFVYNVAFRIVGNQQDAQEVAQEVFLIVHRKLSDFRFQSAFKTWIYRITINCAINHAKKSAKMRNHIMGHEGSIPEVMSENEVEKEADREDKDALISWLLKKLNPEQRACVVLRNIEGLSYQQIADSLQININTVRSRLKRAREALISVRKEAMSHELS